MYTLKSTLMSLRSLLCSPEPNDPQDAEVAKHYMSDQAGYEKTAREWTRTYATKEAASKGADTAGSADQLAALAGLDKAHVDQFAAMVRQTRRRALR